jgi:hypothetical protein
MALFSSSSSLMLENTDNQPGVPTHISNTIIFLGDEKKMTIMLRTKLGHCIRPACYERTIK